MRYESIDGGRKPRRAIFVFPVRAKGGRISVPGACARRRSLSSVRQPSGGGSPFADGGTFSSFFSISLFSSLPPPLSLSAVPVLVSPSLWPLLLHFPRPFLPPALCCISRPLTSYLRYLLLLGGAAPPSSLPSLCFMTWTHHRSAKNQLFYDTLASKVFSALAFRLYLVGTNNLTHLI